MLDTINYSKNPDGSFTKTIVNIDYFYNQYNQQNAEDLYFIADLLSQGWTRIENNWQKVNTYVSIITDTVLELNVLNAQLDNFKLGEQTDEITAAITNYQQAIAVLEAN